MTATDHVLPAAKPRHRWCWRLVALLLSVLLGGYLLAWLGTPWAIRYALQPAKYLPAGLVVKVDTIRFNPFNLRLHLGHVVVNSQQQPRLLTIDAVDARISWYSLRYRLPILAELHLLRPQLQLQRLANGQLNIAELVQQFSQPSTGPSPKFAIANIRIRDGQLRLDDLYLHQQHRIEQLQLAIPLLATVAAHGEPELRPQLDLRIDGQPLHVDGRAQAFADHFRTSLQIQLSQADLPTYLAYLPTPLPLRVATGKLSGQIQLDYDAGLQPSQLSLHGQLQIQQLRLQNSAPQPLLELAQADIEGVDVQPLQQHYQFSRIRLSQPVAHLRLDAQAQPRDLAALSPSPAPASHTTATPALIAGIKQLLIEQGQLQVQGAQPTQQVQLKQIQLQLHDWRSQGSTPSAFTLSGQLDHAGQLHIEGQLQPSRLQAQIGIHGWSLASSQPWLPSVWQQQLGLDARLDAELAAQLEFSGTPQLHLDHSQIRLSQARLSHPGVQALHWQSLQLDISQLDTRQQQIQLHRIVLQQLQLSARSNDAGLDWLQHWPAPNRSSTTAAPAWRWRIDQFQLQQAALRWQPAADAKPLQAEIAQLTVKQLSSEQTSQAHLALSAHTAPHGAIHLSGPFSLWQQTAHWQVQVEHFDLVPWQGLWALPLPIEIQQAHLSAKGRLDYRADQTPSFNGDVQLNHVSLLDTRSGKDLMHWDRLQLDRLDYSQHHAQTRLGIGQVGLAGFYARVIVNPDGHTNLQQLLAAPNTVHSTTRLVSIEQPSATGQGIQRLPTLQVSASPPLQLEIGGVRLLQGRLNYSDDFVKPNFNADITGLSGQIGRFGNIGGAPADVTIFGTLNQLSPVLIEGKLDPLAASPAADISGTANSIPLPNLSTYSSRYTGYPITSGLLNAEVHYRLRDDKLSAENHLLISQLSFGPAVKTPGVAHLPVKLAIALLKNSRGEIDIRLPVSGSLSDPQFSISDLFWHALGDLVTRAASSPFRLLAAAFGDQSSQQELAQLRFAPGEAQLDAAAIAHLEKLVGMLNQRPKLNLDITGHADPTLDLKGLREHWVDNEVRSEYHRQHIDLNGPMPKLSDADYHSLLVRVYHRDRFKKPKNFIGMETTPSDAAMIDAIRSHAGIGVQQLQNLASKRALAVAGWLHGKIDDNRVSLHVPQMSDASQPASTTGAPPVSGARVDLGLH